MVSVLALTLSPGLNAALVDALWVLGLLAFLGAVFALFHRYNRKRNVETPSSGNWVAWLRTIVDLGIGLTVLVWVVTAISGALDPGGVSFTPGQMSVDSEGIALRFETGNSQSIGEVVPPSVLKDRAENAGRGFDPEDDQLGRVREQYGDDARLYGAEEVLLDVSEPGAVAWVAAALAVLLSGIPSLVALLALRALLAKAAEGAPFHPRSVFWLRVMAAAIVVWVVGPGVAEWVVARELASAGGAREQAPFSMDTSWLWASFVLLALAEIWRYGVALQREAEATV